MLAYHFPPLASAGVFRPLRFVRYLPEFGWPPIVLTALPENENERQDFSLMDKVPPGVTVVRTGLWQPEARIRSWLRFGRRPERVASHTLAAVPSISPARDTPPDGLRGMMRGLARNVHDLAFMTPDDRVWWMGPAVAAAMRLVREYRPRVLFTTGPPHSIHLIGLVLKRLTGLPLVIDFRDPWSRRPWGKKPRNPWGQRLLGHLERLCVRYADRVILNSHNLGRDFRKHYGARHAQKFTVIPNGYDPEMLHVVEQLAAGMGQNRKGGPLRLCHPGSLYRRRDPRPILAAVKQLVDRGRPVIFEQIGHCESAAEVQSFVERNRLDEHVRMEGPVPHENIIRRMAAADVLMVVQPENALQVPGKLFEMMMFRKPIVALADEGETAEIVEKYHLGAVARSNDAGAIAACIERAGELSAARCRENGWASALAAYDGRQLTGDLAEVFCELVDGDDKSRARPGKRQGERQPDIGPALTTVGRQSKENATSSRLCAV